MKGLRLRKELTLQADSIALTDIGEKENDF